jgi:6-phosphogluconolactonase/glucosamine-6-phosphate isomerase/deaminase
MQFLREDQKAAVRTIAARICDELFAGKRVLWLTSGGSNVNAEVIIMQALRTHCADKLDGLAILPMDERYGAPGHENSNTEALRHAGFDPGAATWVDVLMHDVSFEQTVSFYNEIAATALSKAGVVIGQFGLGSDAHVAGVLPGSPAVNADETTVAGYEWEDYVRMTLTPTALKQVDTAYVLAYGEGKKDALERLRANIESLSELPAKLLYDIPEIYVYNDAIKSKG